MLKFALAAGAVAVLLGAAPASAQDASIEEVVVTGSRMIEWDPDDVPHVQLARRADNLIATVAITCDTRDDAQRARELRETVMNVIKAAQASPTIDLGLGADVVGEFDATMLDRLITPDRTRAQVSTISLVVKTAITRTDTFDQASGRLKAFVAGVRVVGRSEALIKGDFDVTLIGPDRYRPDLLRAMADDARKTAEAFGPGYRVQVDGLANRVTWRQTGPLDLTLFIPYKLMVTPGS